LSQTKRRKKKKKREEKKERRNNNNGGGGPASLCLRSQFLLTNVRGEKREGKERRKKGDGRGGEAEKGDQVTSTCSTFSNSLWTPYLNDKKEQRGEREGKGNKIRGEQERKRLLIIAIE